MATSACAGIRVVSDIDDTAKISNVGDPLAAIANGLFGKRAFAGMRELYQSLAIDRKYAFDYVTGAPDAIRFLAQDFLSDAGFPDGKLYTRPFIGLGDLRKYRLRVIRELMDANPNDDFIFVGDDTGSDFDVYDELFRSAPERVLAIYIRKVTNRNIPPSAYSFLTAFDIARIEFTMGRLEVIQAAPVALAILGEKKDKRIIPGYSYCPVNVGILDAQMNGWNTAINARVQAICLKRKSTTEVDSHADLD
jgi:hypothetical protein